MGLSGILKQQDDEFIEPGEVELGVVKNYTTLTEKGPIAFKGKAAANIKAVSSSERFTLFVLTGVAYPCYIWAYACEYIFSPTLIKTRYKLETYNPDQVREKIPKWIAEYQDKTAIRQFREAGLYNAPGPEKL